MSKRDSSKTRVGPVSYLLYDKDKSSCSWLPRIIGLPTGGHTLSLPPGCHFYIKDCGRGAHEKILHPPISLLSWLIPHPQKPNSGGSLPDAH